MFKLLDKLRSLHTTWKAFIFEYNTESTVVYQNWKRIRPLTSKYYKMYENVVKSDFTNYWKSFYLIVVLKYNWIKYVENNSLSSWNTLWYCRLFMLRGRRNKRIQIKCVYRTQKSCVCFRLPRNEFDCL